MLKCTFALSLCVCALITTHAHCQPPLDSIKEVDAARKSILAVVTKWQPKLSEQTEAVQLIGNGHEKIERYALLLESVINDLLDTELNLSLIDQIDSPYKRTLGCRTFGTVSQIRLTSCRERREKMEALRVQFRYPGGSAERPEVESDTLLDILNDITAMCDELEKPVKRLRRIPAPKAPGNNTPVS